MKQNEQYFLTKIQIFKCDLCNKYLDDDKFIKGLDSNVCNNCYDTYKQKEMIK